MLWSLAKHERIRPDVRLTAAQRSAVDEAAVDLIELYEKSADCVLVDLHEEWQQIQNSDRSADHFAYILVGEAFDMVEDFGFESLLKGGKPTFAIELRDGELVWNGELREPEKRNPTIPSEAEYLGETLGAPEINPARASYERCETPRVGHDAYVKDAHGKWRKVRIKAGDGRGGSGRQMVFSDTGYPVRFGDLPKSFDWDTGFHVRVTREMRNPAGSDHYYIGHRDGENVSIDAEHGQFGTLEEALDVAGKMDASTRHRSVIVRQGDVYQDGEHWHTDVTLYSIATGELLLQENPQWDKSEIQSLLFDNRTFTETQAKHWAKEHGFHYGAVDNTAHYHRLRQFPPAGGPCRTIELGHHGVKAIVCSAAHGRPPWLPNPGHKFIGGRVSVWPRRTPTIEEIAAAWRYVEHEYTLKEGNVDGEQWAEGLAFWKYAGDRDDVAAAREIFPQFTEEQWQSIAARADRLRFDQQEPPRYAPETTP